MQQATREHFEGMCQYTKVCTTCNKRDVLHPETLFVSLDCEVTDLVQSIEDNLVDSVDMDCDNCATKTPHVRIGFLISMPMTLTIVFKRFVNNENVEVKSDVNVLLPSHLVISCD